MQKIILHIGTHKTGTTSIQRILTKYYNDLLDYKILYPIAGRPFNGFDDGHHLLSWSALDEKPLTQNTNWQSLLDEINVNSPDLILLSSEDFEFCSATDVERIYEFLNSFEVNIIIYLRNQMDFMVSEYKQNVKSGIFRDSFRIFIRTFYDRCNYFRLLNNWTDVFGIQQVHIRIYDKVIKRQGLIQDFLTICAFPTKIQNLLTKDHPSFNVSPPNEAIRLLGYLNRIEQSINPSDKKPLEKFDIFRQQLINQQSWGRRLLNVTRPLLKQSLNTPEDSEWLRQAIHNWNTMFLDRYIDKEDWIYFKF